MEEREARFSRDAQPYSQGKMFEDNLKHNGAGPSGPAPLIFRGLRA